MRKRNELAEGLVNVFVHPNAAQGKVHAVFVENTHDDSFAVEHWNDGHAQVDLAVGDLDFDTSVLRYALFGNIESRHNLQTADDRRLEAIDLRWSRLSLEYAVDSVANLHSCFLSFDVNVARSRLNRFCKDIVDKSNDGRFLRHRGVSALIPIEIFV